MQVPLPLQQDVSPPGPFAALQAIAFVRHPRARRYLIRVTAEGTVRVTVPRRGSKREAAAFAVPVAADGTAVLKYRVRVTY